VLSNIKNTFQRKITLAPKEHQTQDEISAIRDNMDRVSFIINVRWMLVLVLVVYSVIGFIIHLSKNDFSTLAGYMAIPANALILVCIYNYFFMRYKDVLANIAAANIIQLVLDSLVVTLLVYFSGGVESWFWVIYLLFLFELAAIAPRKTDAWWLALGLIVLLGCIEWGNFFGILPHVSIPLSSGHSWRVLEYVLLRYLWQVTVLIGTALVATRLLTPFRNKLAKSRNIAILDELTGLYSREYFKRALEMESVRALHDRRPVFVALIDIDNFSRVNKIFGIGTGDAILGKIARAIQADVEKFAKTATTPNLVARISGEEFAIVFNENAHAHDGQPTVEDVGLLLRAVSQSIAEIDYEGISVTASIGYAGLPQDAIESDVLLERADEALISAISQGGNTVVAFSDCVDEGAPFIGLGEEPLETVSRYLDE